MRQWNGKQFLLAIAVCLAAALPGCAAKKGAELFSARAGGGELPFMPDGLLCGPDDAQPEPDQTPAEESCQPVPEVPCHTGPARPCFGRRIGMVEPIPLVDARQTRSQFHPVPTRPVFLPQPNRGMMGIMPFDQPDTSSADGDETGSPQIEMILPEPSPEKLPTPPVEDDEPQDRVTSKPSWIFRAASRRPASIDGEASLAADSAAFPYRR